MSLRQILEDRDPELFGRLMKIEKIAGSLLGYTHGKFPYYTPHNFSHSLNVEENLNWMIIDDFKEKMNPCEIFFLIVAAWMHDWGMVGKPEEDPAKIREVHHLRTERYFEEMYDKLYLSEHEGRIIGRICRGHTKEDLYSKDFDDIVFGSNIRIRRRFLAAILRIADECDITCNRIPEIIYYSLNPTDKAEEEFQTHLSISGIGQLDERHKIYISAITRDPKGAETLRELRDKVQRELNNVKGILAQYGIVLDYVELKLETRGFIDKPISFEVDKKRIVGLLIGEHLYRNRDVAIRELVHNSIDACKLQKQIEPDTSFKITLRRPAQDILEVEDNGIGMDYSTAKRFLSIVGASYYDSEEFKRFIEDKKFDPIAKFGIGIMSCFLISEGVTIETKKKGFDPCRFTVDSTEQAWKYEKGSLENPGTKIVLRLSKEGKMINTQETLEKFFIAPEVPIYYQADNGEIKKFESIWSIDQIVKRFYQRFAHAGAEVSSNEILQFETEDYRVIFGIVDPPVSAEQLILFNHGTFVGNFEVAGLAFDHIICVDLKKDLLDLQISREDIIRNERWSNFVHNVLNSLFERMSDQLVPDKWETYIHRVSRMSEERWTFGITSSDKLDVTLERFPFLKSFFNKVFFPIKSQNGIELQRLDNIFENDEITLYSAYSREPLKEIKFVSEVIYKNRVAIFDPYQMPEIVNEKNEYEKPVCFLLKKQGIKVYKIDLLNILIENCSPLKVDFEDLVPRNVKLARFPKNWKPLVVIYKKPSALITRDTLGAAYWCNIFLWRSLIGDDRAYETLNGIIRKSRYLEDIKLLSEPIVYVDVEDEFLERLFNLRGKKLLDEKISKTIFRYLRYLAFLPLAIGHLTSCLVFLETLDSLEAEIASFLDFDRPRPLLQRMGTIRNIYLEYLDANLENLYEVKKSARTAKLSKKLEN